AVSSLCWQRSKPAIVNESTCTVETALLGGAREDSVLMPDPLPSGTSTSLSSSIAVFSSRITGRSGSAEVFSLTSGSGSTSSTFYLSSSLETPTKSHLWPGGTLTRLHAPHSTFNFKDDMELWDGHDGAKKEHLPNYKKPSSLLFPFSRRFAFAKDGASDHHYLIGSPDVTKSFTTLESTPTPSFKSKDTSITPLEAWGGEKTSDKFAHLRQLSSRFGMQASGGLTTSSIYAGQDQCSMLSQTMSNLSYENFHTKDVSLNQESSSLGFPEHFSSSSMSALSFSLKGITRAGSLDSPKLAPLAPPRRFSTYAGRISTTSTFSDRTSHLVASPKIKKTGAETREDLFNNLLSKSDSLTAAASGVLLAMNGGTLQPLKASQQDPQQGINFTLQLFHRTLEETLDSFQKSIHRDMRNLHMKILRQFHIREMEMSRVMSSILQNQAEMMEEVKSLRKENQ
ncbi:hypothetical protein Goshw_000791, partial [Gossypium schwendimanii]|nr:hypothetical protein [Gossypium schwendimanii]MBA0878447.1 hypothetical protein [Gossypium schwendimanii]